MSTVTYNDMKREIATIQSEMNALQKQVRKCTGQLKQLEQQRDKLKRTLDYLSIYVTPSQ